MEFRDLFDFLGEPLDSARRTREGVYESYELGDPEHRIRVILLDTRWSLDETEGRMLCEEQWAWLECELLASKQASARLTIVVTSVQALASQRFFGEGWRLMPKERGRLLRLLATTRPGPLFMVSGDVHFSHLSYTFSQQEAQSGIDDVWVQPVYEITFSGMTHSLGYWPPQLMGLRGRWLGTMQYASLIPFTALLPLLRGAFTVCMRFPHSSGQAVTEYPSYPYFGRHYGTASIDWNQPDPILSWRVHGLDPEARSDISEFSNFSESWDSPSARPAGGFDWQTRIVREWNFTFSQLSGAYSRDLPLLPVHHPWSGLSGSEQRVRMLDYAQRELAMATRHRAFELPLKRVGRYLLALFLAVLTLGCWQACRACPCRPVDCHVLGNFGAFPKCLPPSMWSPMLPLATPVNTRYVDYVDNLALLHRLAHPPSQLNRGIAFLRAYASAWPLGKLSWPS
eukprot:g16824.t1